jgi:hypothetical protein
MADANHFMTLPPWAMSVSDRSHPPHRSLDPLKNEMIYSIEELPRSFSHGIARAQSPHRPRRQ